MAGYGEGCGYWTGYCHIGLTVLGPTFMFSQNFTTGEQSVPAAQLFDGTIVSDPNSGAVTGGFFDGYGGFEDAAFKEALFDNCPASCLLCPTPWQLDEEVASNLFDDASMLPGYGFCRTVNDVYPTEAREDPLCSQDKVDAGVPPSTLCSSLASHAPRRPPLRISQPQATARS